MKQKSAILVFMIILVLIVGFGAAIFLLNEISKEAENKNGGGEEPSPEPTSYIDIKNGTQAEFKYAAINADDTVTLFTELGENLDIELERHDWSNLKWSPDGSILSMFGRKSEGSNVDINFYMLEDHSSRWITTYELAEAGVSSYFWVDKDSLLFIQGAGSTNWLHEYYHPTLSQKEKIEKLNGTFVELSPDNNKAIFSMDNTNELRAFNLMGVELWNIGDMKDEGGDDLEVNSILFTKDPNKLVFTVNSEDGDVILYKTLFQSTVGVELEIMNLTPICAYSADEIIAYAHNSATDQFAIRRVEVKDDYTVNAILERNLEGDQIDLDTLQCFDKNKVIFRMTKDREEKPGWFIADNDTLTEIEFLSDAEEVSVAPEISK